MSRSAADATRFTATSPHAYSKPTPIRSNPNTFSASSASRSRFQPQRQPSPNNSGQIPPNSNGRPPPPPPSETPQEKVTRLRAARFAARDAQISTWEKVVIRGRIWADRAHKFTTLTLVGLTVLAGGITAFALTDMILHNRRKRAAFYSEQHALYTSRLLAAIETDKAGIPLDEDQVIILNRERAKVRAEEEKQKGGLWKGVKGVFVGGLKKDMDDERTGDKDGRALEALGGKVPSEGEVLERIGVGRVGVLETAEGKMEEGEGGVLKTVGEKRRGNGESTFENKNIGGGPLDRMAERAVEDARGRVGWTSWVTGR